MWGLEVVEFRVREVGRGVWGAAAPQEKLVRLE